ncbi:PREDICTED: aminoacyl tRNA synthase complex-interacting multifunctional protein 2-like isoform X2 [Wasmannia auropunctata]|uniref:aminoacyl tRNA synthase complex-interacting multifunctional protein 2-like isoform X2 n=1 Tax=Wasmannia auropunctata TaxID=64793 RepID=UPI0005EEB6D7|nr:PREDICTED: aminoacyl tRNA synthase complex-interacting multifunctional protein 2-like isoform X2 [Wasmannia auropunctata]
MSDRATMATSTSSSMYRLPPVFVLPADFPHSSSMHRIRNMHEDTRARPCHRDDAANTEEAKMPDDAVESQASLPEYEALEARQERILSQLAELKKQVSTLCHFLKQPNHVEGAKNIAPVQKPVVVKLVVHANPRKPPYSILALQKLWRDTNIEVTSYTHSTLKDQISIVFPKTVRSSINVIELTLIWKEVSDMETVVNMRSCPIRGEVNFLRLVSRLIESRNYESTCSQPQTLDFALDFANFLHSQKCINEGLIALADEFDKWSCKGGFNIVDIAVWSLIKQFNKTDLPPVLRNWFAQCESAFIEKTDRLISHDK